MKVLFVCSGGLSSGIILQTLQEEATKQGVQMKIKSVGTEQFETEILNGWDIAMVAPQVRHRYQQFKAAADLVQVPCEIIPLQAYSPLGGSMLLETIKRCLGID
ncbi:PTS system, cellobiose-specific IIB component [Seinonella peptonophila]|uniref:PTS system, cellobiose-specific IIB component n=1 Tax=Seinonella peptonophila TaxID=112248 RepID=A0A1M4TCQ8_9BACL|nr:PTS sugar transporter subunit IIB [Seinonella peptonophila]SHE42165.1 PTS system, cellobiose-specific IIB component [Seinonella peptonophila]